MRHNPVKQPSIAVEAQQYKRVLKWEAEPVLTLTLNYPKLSGDTPGCRRVNRYYCQVVRQWRSRWEGALYEQAKDTARSLREVSRPFHPWEATLSYQITCQADGLLSLYLDAYEYAGGAHGMTVRQGDTWSMPEGTFRSLRSFFPPHFRWRQWVLEQVARSIQARLNTGDSWFEPNWQEQIVREFDPERFYCTPEGPSVFYPLYCIAPYAEGIPVFPITLPGSGG